MPVSDPSFDVRSSPPLLVTKLYFPPVHHRLVSRPRLIAQIQQGMHGPLTLVAAPAGSGKTTLLSEWRAGAGSGVLAAWLSLDAGDNDPVKFVSYVIAALQTVVPDAGKMAQSMLSVAQLRDAQTLSLDTILTSLINDLCTFPGPIVLVLDDYHVIDAAAIHQGVAFLIDNAPPTLHFVILTRSDPPLPLSRLRARGQVVEIRARHLRFTSEEIEAFLRQKLDLKLTREEVAALETRSEGWIAGLQLAALSMQGREDASDFVAAFTGTHHYIVDYLVDEVLDRQSPLVRDFLLSTSILDRMCGPLCDAVAQMDIPADHSAGKGQDPWGEGGVIERARFSDSQAILEYLERANLFIVQLDEARCWYRYHQLFAGVLQARLQHTGPERVAALHRRAAAWYEAQQLNDEALHHTLAARDYAGAVLLLRRYWSQMMRFTHRTTFLRLLDRFPRDVVQADPWLCIVYAWILWSLGHVDTVSFYVEQAQVALTQLVVAGRIPPDDFEYATLPAEIAVFRSMIAGQKGQVEAAIAHARRALALAPEDAATIRGLAYVDLYIAYRDMGRLDQAIEACEQAIPVTRAGGIPGPIVSAVYGLGLLCQLKGHLHRAMEVYREGLRYAESQGEADLPVYCLIYIAMGEVYYEWDARDEARRALHVGLDLAALRGDLWMQAYGYGLLARLYHADQDDAGADESAARVEHILQQVEVMPFRDEISAHRARMYADLGLAAEAAAWVDTSTLGLEHVLGYVQCVHAMVRARVLLALGRLEAALTLLTKVESTTRSWDGRGWHVELLTLQACVWQRRGDATRAQALLERALVLAEPEGYVRTFVDQGSILVPLLQTAVQHGVTPAYAARLLAASRESAPVLDQEAKSKPQNPQSNVLVEPLSDRELEVLRLVAAGKTNKAIAAELFLATGTVKKHLNNIFGKLDVRNRTECVARARALALL